MNIECKCGNKYVTLDLPCPDGIEGCLVAHTDRTSYVCPACGTDNVPDLSKGVTMEVGVGMFNVGGLAKLDIYREP